ncbi:hypothetical protein OH77DRAFT_1221310 [Trametes cingulata]|nr:hypothetical protein OH77DRAFT_1221310 [Trametes cingulata]
MPTTVCVCAICFVLAYSQLLSYHNTRDGRGSIFGIAFPLVASYTSERSFQCFDSLELFLLPAIRSLEIRYIHIRLRRMPTGVRRQRAVYCKLLSSSEGWERASERHSNRDVSQRVLPCLAWSLFCLVWSHYESRVRLTFRLAPAHISMTPRRRHSLRNIPNVVRTYRSFRGG